MTALSSNGIEICYDTFGKPGEPCILLISGLGEQMTSWPQGLCRQLSDCGFFVIRFDNRDTGLSAKLEDKGIPDLDYAWDAYYNSLPIIPPYTLHDMAADADGVLEQLHIEKALICGFSLGGMIAQNMAHDFPHRVAGMICMGSSTGDLTLPPPKPEAGAAMTTPPPDNREGFIQHSVSVFKAFSGGSGKFSPECRQDVAGTSYDRSYYPVGFMRQSVAMLADGSRTHRLETLDVPTLVMHGELDPLAPVDHGRAIARAVKNAEFTVLPDWGHGMDYPDLWPVIAGRISKFQDMIS